jgi:citrate lyase subunit beta/citryl-CoA lyase
VTVGVYADPMAAGKGAVRVDGQLVGEATNTVAKDIVETTEAAGVL